MVVDTVMMVLSTTLASVVFAMLDQASTTEPVAAPLTTLATLVVVATLSLRGSALLRLWVGDRHCGGLRGCRPMWNL